MDTFQRIKGKELNRVSKEYILNAIDGEGYDIPSDALITTEGKLRFVWETFNKEYGWAIDRYGVQGAMREWLMGLPSVFNIDFENYKIIQIAKEWGSIPDDASEKEEDKILSNWFNFIAAKTLHLMRLHKVI